jgi:hypothetical protein
VPPEPLLNTLLLCYPICKADSFWDLSISLFLAKRLQAIHISSYYWDVWIYYCSVVFVLRLFSYFLAIFFCLLDQHSLPLIFLLFRSYKFKEWKNNFHSVSGYLKKYDQLYFFVCFFETVSLCNPDWPWICGPPASASWGMGLQMCTTTPGWQYVFLTQARIIQCYLSSL